MTDTVTAGLLGLAALTAALAPSPFGAGQAARAQGSDDTTAPAVSTATVDGATLELEYDEVLDPGSIPAAGDFMVGVAGTDQTPAAVSLSGGTVTLTLGTAATGGQTVTVTYTAGTNPVRDASLNNAADLSARSVTNTTGLAAPAVTAVAIVSTPPHDGDRDGTADTYAPDDKVQVRLTYGSSVSVNDVGGKPRLKISLDPSGGDRWAAYASGSGSTALTFAYTVAKSDLSWRGVAVLQNTLESNGGRIRSTSTKKAASLSHAGLGRDTGHKVDGVPPRFLATTSYLPSTGRWKFLARETLDPDSVPGKDAFRVQVGGVDWDFSLELNCVCPCAHRCYGAVRALDVTLSPILTTAQTHLQRRFVYTPPSTNPLKDLAGNAMAGFDTYWGNPPTPPPPGGGPSPPDPEPEPEPEPPSPPPPTPLTASFSVDVDCDDGLCRALTGQHVTFTDTSSGTVARRSWDFFVPAERALTAETVRHAWDEPGFYEVTLTVSGAEQESRTSRMFLVEASDPAGTCAPDGETACFLDSRYAVRATWKHPDGDTRAGRVVHAGTNESGLFWLHDRENWETLVKVLDGCSVNRAHWVFIASATDLGFEITITDTVTGAEYLHVNEVGTPAAAVTDTAAFTEAFERPG